MLSRRLQGHGAVMAAALALLFLASCALAEPQTTDPPWDAELARYERDRATARERSNVRDGVGGLTPPPLTEPQRVEVSVDATSNVLSLDPERDYVVAMPDEPLRRGLVLKGGRNVVLIGGEIDIPWQGTNPTIAQRTGLKIVGATGTVHVEGLLLHGEDISEGIQIDAPQAIVQLQNIGVFGIHARDQVDFSDNHPDIVQTYGNVRELHIDGLTGSSDYQGLLFKVDVGPGPHGPVTLRNVNLIGLPTARYLLWLGTEPGFGTVTLDDVWIDVPPERDGGLRRSVWPPANGDHPDRATILPQSDGRHLARWPHAMNPTVVGVVREGRPPGGDFVSPGAIGIGYERPDPHADGTR